MAGQKSGKAPSGTFAPGGSEVYDDDRDYFTDKTFGRVASLEQSKQQTKDQDRLRDERQKLGLSRVDPDSYRKGGSVRARDATRGAFRTGGPNQQPDFAAGGGILNKKSYNKGAK